MKDISDFFDKEIIMDYFESVKPTRETSFHDIEQDFLTYVNSNLPGISYRELEDTYMELYKNDLYKAFTEFVDIKPVNENSDIDKSKPEDFAKFYNGKNNKVIDAIMRTVQQLENGNNMVVKSIVDRGMDTKPLLNSVWSYVRSELVGILDRIVSYGTDSQDTKADQKDLITHKNQYLEKLPSVDADFSNIQFDDYFTKEVFYMIKATAIYAMEAYVAIT
jgi:hypothetical protein